MRGLKFPVLILLALFLSGPVWAQKRQEKHRRSFYTRFRYTNNNTKVPRSKAGIICPGASHADFPYQAAGIKIGDPFAFTYRLYPNKQLALGLDFGKSASGLYNRYYREQFDTFTPGDTLTSGAELLYLTHTVQSDWVAEFKVLYVIDMDKLSQGLQFYVGAGAEWRSTQLMYTYNYQMAPNVNSEIGQFKRSRFTQGLEAVIGVEYSYFNLPISAFIELELYNDIRADPGWRHPQGGIGIRYVF